jgi:hypothetical protein
MKIKEIYFEDMDHSAVYVQSSNLNGLIKSHRSRPIYKITFKSNSIFRKIRSKAIEGLDKDSIILDHISMVELNVENGTEITLKKANSYERWITYYCKNPIEEVRVAWYYFVFSQLIAFVSLIIGIISLTK